MPRRKSSNPALTNVRLTKTARDQLSYLRDVVFKAKDYSSAIGIITRYRTGSEEPWEKSGHIWEAKAQGYKGKWLKKPGPKGRQP